MSTLKSSREIDRVFQQGRRTADPLIIALVAPTPTGRDQSGRVAFIAGKRLGGAVTRNRAKRRLRAAMRAAGGPWQGKDVLLIAREPVLSAHGDVLTAAIARVTQRAGLKA